MDRLALVSTGIGNLDEILKGGLPRGKIYVVNGIPGTGKTILSLHFLAAGAQAGEKVLFITLAQRVDSLRQAAAAINICTDGISFKELSTAQALQTLTEQQTIFDTSELELEDTLATLNQSIKDIQPQRVVFDSISSLRMLASDPLTYRQRLLTLRDFLDDQGITVMLTDTQEVVPGDSELVAMADGVITLSRTPTNYGKDRRSLYISKIRNSSYLQGYHDMEITSQGIQLYPLHRSEFNLSGNGFHPTTLEEGSKALFSGLDGLDNLLGGGLQTGTSCLLLGPSGTGKTTIATQFAHQCMQRGGKVSILLFDELMKTLIQRTKGLGMDVLPFIDSGQMRFYELSLGSISPGRLFQLLRRDVKDWGAEIIIIDTLTGYFKAMPDDLHLAAQMHDLLMFLNAQEVLSFLVVAQHGAVGPNLNVPVDVSYLTDTVLLLRHFEFHGELRQAISVYKKRFGLHERQIREMRLTSAGIQIGQPLNQFTGIMSGMPDYIGESQELMPIHD